jgi:hypothetical protein
MGGRLVCKGLGKFLKKGDSKPIWKDWRFTLPVGAPIYVHVITNINTFMHVTHSHAHITRMHMHTHTCMLTHSHTLTHKYACSFTHTHTCTHSLTHTHTHTRTHSLTHSLTHKHASWFTHKGTHFYPEPSLTQGSCIGRLIDWWNDRRPTISLRQGRPPHTKM